MNDKRSTIERWIRDAGLRITPQRYAILDHLLCTKAHPTAEQISAELNSAFPRASRATIYNALNVLREAQLVHEVRLDDAAARYEANIGKHHHFVCRGCGSLEDIGAEALLTMPEYELGDGYVVEHFEIVLRGLCADCSPRSTPNNSNK
jgi:Fur family peroxide stress response transcriptional regulator